MKTKNDRSPPFVQKFEKNKRIQKETEKSNLGQHSGKKISPPYRDCLPLQYKREKSTPQLSFRCNMDVRTQAEKGNKDHDQEYWQFINENPEEQERRKLEQREVNKEKHRIYTEKNKGLSTEEKLKARRQRARDQYKANPERYKEEKRKYSHRLTTWLKTYQANAKNKGLSWTISDDIAFVMFCDTCLYCNKTPEENGKPMGIDRFDSDIGYEPGNVTPCCSTCNYAKRILSITEFTEMCTRVARVRGILRRSI